MSTKVFLVIEHGGEYEDKYSIPRHVWSTAELANKHCKELADELAEFNRIVDLIGAFENDYYNKNSIPNISYPTLEKEPKGPSHTKAKKEMTTLELELHTATMAELKRQRDGVRERNRILMDKVYEVRNNYNAQMHEAVVEYTKSITSIEKIINYMENGRLYRFSHSESEFEFTELDLD